MSFFAGILFVLTIKRDMNPKMGKMTLQFLLIFLIPWGMQTLKVILAGYNCFWHGSRFYLVITLPSIFVGVGLAASALITNKRFGVVLYIVYYILMAIWPLSVLYFYQQIYFYHPLIGIFPGTVYDEYIPITSTLLFHQIGCVCIALTLVCILMRRTGKRSFRTSNVMMLLLAVIVLLYEAPFSPFVTSRKQLEEQLVGRIETKHFLIFFKDGSLTKEHAEDIGFLHEVYFEQLRQFYQTEPQNKIHSYIFNSPGEKYRLLGTAAADFAKPWKSEMYISDESIDYTLKHELSHIFTAAFGYSPFKLSHGFNPAILEGAATASSQCYEDFPLNYLAFQAYKLDSTLSVPSLFGGLSFFSGVSSKSYCISGSFSRYMVNSYGILNFRNAYKNGFSRKIYGKSLKELGEEYRTNLFSQGFTFNKDLAEYYFGGRGLLQKTSPHYVAELTQKANELMLQGRYIEALESLKASKGSLIAISLLKVKILEKLKRFDEEIVLLREIREECSNTGACRDVELTLADCYFKKGDLVKAGNMYKNLREHANRPFFNSICAARSQALQSGEHAADVFSEDVSMKFEHYSRLLRKSNNSSLVPVVLVLSNSGHIPYNITKEVIQNWFKNQKTVDEFNALWLLRFALNHRDVDFAKDILYKNDSKSIIFSPAISEERKKMRTIELLHEKGFVCNIWVNND